MERYREAGNGRGESCVLTKLGAALGGTRNAEVVGHLERSLAIRREVGDHTGEAQAANNLADIYQRLGRTEEALGLLPRTLDLNREVGDQDGEGVALVNLGSTLLDPGQTGPAIEYLRQAQRDFPQ